MNKEKRYKILSLFDSKNPNPNTELVFSSNFEFLLCVILSAKSTDVIVNKTTKILFKIANTPESILLLGLERLKNYIKHIGLYNTKALNIIRTSFLILNKYQGNIPNNRFELESLPGVGRKTSNVILNVLFKKKTIAVDTHVFRVSNRTNFAKGINTEEVEKKLIKVVPNIFKLKIHSWFVLHGRYVCTARTLKCNICFIYSLCEFDKKVF
ncbi:endonuclease III [Buchnera aphidicola (Hyperomyzus lactucae)]|uniref:Endonuclease III n=1 Tax=Buchnera aphidicola (Hyperomyzus lactucae) TaxID=1241860 RepID=A0A4D6Y2X0_9GAMM|nr:endonuclease III [Buchnera aphidicola]QCI20858.1 endonuclease III [Buchnera aphidicola (Hyperomyzus lactucae)]